MHPVQQMRETAGWQRLVSPVGELVASKWQRRRQRWRRPSLKTHTPARAVAFQPSLQRWCKNLTVQSIGIELSIDWTIQQDESQWNFCYTPLRHPRADWKPRLITHKNRKRNSSRQRRLYLECNVSLCCQHFRWYILPLDTIGCYKTSRWLTNVPL